MPGLKRVRVGGAARTCVTASWPVRDLLGGGAEVLSDFHVMRHLADIESIHAHEGTETIQTPIGRRDINGVGALA